jgi:hypothetical protein
MTLWQDPPQTRRQARENERSAQQKAAGQASRRAGTAEPTPGGEIPVVTTPYSFASGKVVDNGEAETPSIPATAFEEPGVNPPSRPNLPGYGASFDALLSPRDEPATAESDSADEDVDGEANNGVASLFRDAPDPDEVEPVTKPVTVLTPAPAPIVPAPAVSAPAASSAAASSPAESSPVGQPVGGQSDRVLTRREMRAMLQAQEANQQAGHVEPALPVTFTPPTAAQPASTGPVSAPEAPAGPTAEVTSSNAGGWPFAPSSAPVAGTPVPAVEAESPVGPSDESAAESATESPDEKEPYQPPVGHWSTAAELDDKNQPFDQIISRSVGSSGSATTTNALILPALPSADATGPLTSTGEILVTGSIDLPRGLGSTGAHPDRLDSSDLDRLLDGEENEFNTSEVAPIRASRAVSTHTSTRGVITPPKKRGGRLPLILMITAGVLAVGVIGLLVAAYVLNVF